MGLCRGNLGNLMQHWVQSAVLLELEQQFGGKDAHLLFTTTHSMAPWSVPRFLANLNQDYSRPQFDGARAHLDHPGASVYEQAWAALSCRIGLPYPSSAVFALHLWRGPLSLVLCETDEAVAAEIRGWLAVPEVINRLQGAAGLAMHHGDWRERFAAGFGHLQGVQVVYAEMDPMRFEHNNEEQCNRDNRAALYGEDLHIVTGAFAETSVPVVLQVSSYSANNNNPHHEVEAAISAGLGQAGFHKRADVRADGNMISLVYSRGIALWENAEVLGGHFAEWIHV